MRYWAVCVGVFVCAATGAGAQFTDSSRAFNFPDRGGVALTTDGSGSLAIGYALIQTGAGAARPSGLSVFHSQARRCCGRRDLGSRNTAGSIGTRVCRNTWIPEYSPCVCKSEQPACLGVVLSHGQCRLRAPLR